MFADPHKNTKVSLVNIELIRFCNPIDKLTCAATIQRGLEAGVARDDVILGNPEEVASRKALNIVVCCCDVDDLTIDLRKLFSSFLSSFMEQLHPSVHRRVGGTQ